MANKYIIFFVTLITTLLFSCNANPDEDYWYINNGKYGGTDFLCDKDTWTENSLQEGFILNFRSDITYENGKIKAYVASGTGTHAASNLSLGNLGSKASHGIDIDIYGNENARGVGIDWFTDEFPSNYWYSLYFSPNGEFKVIYRNSITNEYTTLKTVKPGDSHIDYSKYNNIKVLTERTGDVSFFINGYRVYKIAASDLKIIPGRFFLLYLEKPGFPYTAENPLIAYWKLNNDQK